MTKPTDLPFSTVHELLKGDTEIQVALKGQAMTTEIAIDRLIEKWENEMLGASFGSAREYIDQFLNDLTCLKGKVQ